jgi:hypothetical protein
MPIAARLSHRLVRVLAATAGCALAASPAAAATRAGTTITNTASLRVGDTAGQPSNTVALTVDQLLDVTVAAAVPSQPVDAAAARQVVAFVVGNPGNGDTGYALAGTVAGGGTVAGVAIDADGDGRYTDADPVATEVTLAPGESRRVFVLVAGASATGPELSVQLAATAQAGSGAPGTVLPGAGANGGDAVVGQTGARAAAQTALLPGAVAASLVKSQTVLAPGGSSRPVPGAIVTYRLEARFAEASRAAEISDAIPDGTAFVPGSLQLDGVALSDAADGDAGRVDGAGVTVALGDVAAASTRTVQFQVRIL